MLAGSMKFSLTLVRHCVSSVSKDGTTQYVRTCQSLRVSLYLCMFDFVEYQDTHLLQCCIWVSAKQQGVTHVMQVHELTKRREYMGAVMDLAKAVSECPSGGQIVCCSATFASILDQQARILQQVPQHADHDVLYEMLR